jgi:hypothetical protein
MPPPPPPPLLSRKAKISPAGYVSKRAFAPHLKQELQNLRNVLQGSGEILNIDTEETFKITKIMIGLAGVARRAAGNLFVDLSKSIQAFKQAWQVASSAFEHAERRKDESEIDSLKILVSDATRAWNDVQQKLEQLKRSSTMSPPGGVSAAERNMPAIPPWLRQFLRFAAKKTSLTNLENMRKPSRHDKVGALPRKDARDEFVERLRKHGLEDRFQMTENAQSLDSHDSFFLFLISLLYDSDSDAAPLGAARAALEIKAHEWAKIMNASLALSRGVASEILVTLHREKTDKAKLLQSICRDHKVDAFDYVRKYIGELLGATRALESLEETPDFEDEESHTSDASTGMSLTSN